MKEFLLKAGTIFVLLAFVMAVIGSTGYLFYDGHVLFAIVSLIADALAIPSVIKLVKYLIP